MCQAGRLPDTRNNNMLTEDGAVDCALPSREQRGRELYARNHVYRDLANVMEHPVLRQFIDQYFTNPTDARAMMLLMQTYRQTDHAHPSLTGYEKIAVVQGMVNTAVYRRNMVHSTPSLAECLPSLPVPTLSVTARQHRHEYEVTVAHTEPQSAHKTA